jgi:Na+/H+ antiporter NhaC
MWYIVIRGITYGPLQKYEQNAQEEMDLRTTSSQWVYGDLPNNNQEGKMRDFLIPIFILVAAVFCGILLHGKYWIFGGENRFFDAVKSAPMNRVLATAGLISFFTSALFFLGKKMISFAGWLSCCWSGLRLMMPSLIMLIFAWTLGSLVKNDLQTGAYIAQLLGSWIVPSYFPFVCFVCGAVISTLIGSAWATIALMLPVVINMVRVLFHVSCPISALDTLFLFPIVGATLSSCIVGNHISLMADALIMGSAAVEVSHFELARCMIWYVVPLLIASGMGYLWLGNVLTIYSPWVAWFSSLSVSIGILILLFEMSAYFWRISKRSK